jgi:hypothetical protein
MGNRYTKSFSISFEVLEKLESDASHEGVGLSNVLDRILRKHYDLPAETEV